MPKKTVYGTYWDSRKLDLTNKYRCKKCGYSIFIAKASDTKVNIWELKCNNPSCSYVVELTSPELAEISS